MTLRRVLKWTALSLFSLILIVALVIVFFDWNWLRGPIMRKATEATGRQLAIKGDLDVSLGWPLVHVRAADVTFTNPQWAKEPQMIAVKQLDFSLDIPNLIRKRVFLPDLRLDHPKLALEQAAGGRKTWLLDKQQKDEDKRVPVGRLSIDEGQVSYIDDGQHTQIEADLSTHNTQQQTGSAGVVFEARGRYKNLPLQAKGNSGPVLALEDETTPYPLGIDATIGRTRIIASGRITNLSKLSAIDMNIDLCGDSLALLYPIINIALPDTSSYSTHGRLIHDARMWRYERFGGRIGNSDVAGTLQFDSGGKRPFMHGELSMSALDFADLGPVIGTHSNEEPPADTAQSSTKTTTGTQPGSEQKTEKTEKAGKTERTERAEKGRTAEKADKPEGAKPGAPSRTGKVLPQVPFQTKR